MSAVVAHMKREAAVLFVLWFVASGLLVLRPSPCGFLADGELCLITDTGYGQ